MVALAKNLLRHHLKYTDKYKHTPLGAGTDNDRLIAKNYY